MSAFICSDKTTNALATALVYARVIDPSDPQAIAKMLRDENSLSVAYRYRENPEVEPIVFRFVEASPVQILKLCACYEYQSCEHPGWSTSKAKAAIDSLVQATIRKLDGYAEAEWDMRDEPVEDTTPSDPLDDFNYVGSRHHY